MSQTTIASFILRFAQQDTAADESTPGPWRGVIRHVQSNRQVRFVRMEDALAFIAEYVDLENGEKKEEL